MKHCSVIDSPFILQPISDIKMFNETDDTDSREMAFASERHEEKTVQFKSRRCQSTPNIIERHRSYRQNTPNAPNGKPINQISPVLFLFLD